MMSAATRVKECNLVEERESGYRQKWNKGQVLENDIDVEWRNKEGERIDLISEEDCVEQARISQEFSIYLRRNIESSQKGRS